MGRQRRVLFGLDMVRMPWRMVNDVYWRPLPLKLILYLRFEAINQQKKLICFYIDGYKTLCIANDFSNDGNTYNNNWCLSASYYTLLFLCASDGVSRIFYAKHFMWCIVIGIIWLRLVQISKVYLRFHLHICQIKNRNCSKSYDWIMPERQKSSNC